MDTFIQQLWTFVQQYGIEITGLAFTTIFMVGVIKLVFKKPLAKVDKNGRKAIYEVTSMILMYGLTALWIYARVAWFHISDAAFDMNLVIKTAGTAYVVVKVMYPLYENLGLRQLLRILGNFVLSWSKKKEEKETENKDDNSNSSTVVL